MDKTNSVGAELHVITNLMRRFREGTCLHQRPTELTDMQCRIIGFLFCNRDKDIFQKDIEKEFSIRRATVSIILQTMERKQLIGRETVPYDARLRKVVLTPKAAKLASIADKELVHFEKMLAEGIPEADMDCFFRVIHSIRHNLEKSIIEKQ